MQNGINPKVGVYANIAAVLLVFIGTGLPHTPGVSDAAAQAVQQWALWFAGGMAAVNTVLHLYSADAPGPAVK